MISYLIATNRDLNIGIETIKSIKSMPEHDHEIVICAPQHVLDQVEELPDASIKLVLDDINDGSTYGFNTGYKQCKGDWILTGIDDNVLTLDINKLLYILDTPVVQNAEYQVYNLGGRWTDTMRRNHNNADLPEACWNKEWTVGVSDETFDYSYPVITFPLMSKKTIDEKFGGVYFNQCLIHHYVDHWLGAYVQKKVPDHQFNIYSLQSCWNQSWFEGDQSCIRKYDEKDGATYVRLLKHLIQEDPNCSYSVTI